MTPLDIANKEERTVCAALLVKANPTRDSGAYPSSDLIVTE